MFNRKRRAWINIKFIIVLVVVIVAIGCSLFVVRKAHRANISKRNFDAGQAAFEQKDWAKASLYFQRYLRHNSKDLDILKKYAETRMSIRPLEASDVSAAIAVYRRIIQLDPLDQTSHEKLAELYIGINNFEELAYIARLWLKQDPAGRKAPLWLAEALIGLHRTAEARQTLDDFIKALDALPDKPSEYLQACSLASQVASDPISGGTANEALVWLSHAVEAFPQSVKARASRAQFYRRRFDISGFSEEERLARARKDLEAADALGTENPRLRLFLGAEWLALDELDRADAELHAVDNLSEDVVYKHFYDLRDWTVGKFLLASQLAIKKNDVTGYVSLANKVLTNLTDKRYRARVLPSAVMLYLIAGKVTEAKSCLDEYIATMPTQEEAQQSRQGLIYLKALVARAEAKPYTVIDVLQSAIVMDASRLELWQLLAEAFIQTDQTRRAINALVKCLSINPGDADIALQLAQEYLKRQNWTKAFEIARLAESSDPTDIQIKLLRVEASIYRVAEQSSQITPASMESVSAELTQLRKEHPDRVDIRIMQAIIADNLKKTDEAEKELKMAIEQCQETLRAEMQLVRHYYKNKRMTEAVNTCKAACERNPNVAEPWLLLSNLYVAMTDYKSADTALTQGIQSVTDLLEQRSLMIKRALVVLLYLDRPTGIRLLSDLAEQDAQEIHVRCLLLNIREVQQDTSRAAKLIKELQQAEGENGLYWRYYQAALWLAADDWRSKQSDIVNAVQKCIDSDPEWSGPVLLLAKMYQKLGDPVHMEETCRQGLSRNPSATDIADVLISLLEKQSRFSDAKKVLTQVETNSKLNSAWNVRIAVNSRDFSRAIEELRLRVSNDNQDANSRILLARLLYWNTQNAEQAFALLKEVEAITPNSIALSATKVAILRAEDRFEEAQKILDTYVDERNTFAAYTMRAAYLANTGQLEAAEKDYRKLTEFSEQATDGYELLSSFYRSNQKLDQAIKTLDEGLVEYPEDLGLKRSLIKTLLTSDQVQDQQRAYEMLTALQKKLPQDPELIKLEAMYILQKPTPANLRSARQKLEQVVKLEPIAVNAHLALISIAMQDERYEDARNSAIRAIGSNPNNATLLSARAAAEFKLGNTPIALELAWQVLHQDPSNSEALSVIIQSNNRSSLEKSKAMMESAIIANPKNVDILISLSRICVALEQSKTVIPKLEAYCMTNPDSNDISILVTLADLYRINGDMELAKQKIEQAEKIDPGSLTVINARFLLLLAQKQYDKLSQISSEYLTAKKQNATTLIAAASALMSLDSIELKKEGLKLFEQAVTIAPTKGARLGLANTLYQTGETSRAVIVYQELLKDFPKDLKIINNLAWIMQEHYHSYDAALELTNKGLAISPNDIYLLDTRGTILSNMENRLDDARKDFERLVELTPSDSQQKASALLSLGRICIKLNDLAQAKQHFQNALEIDQKINVFTDDERSEVAKII
ncbi:MAG: tetratricopeptide repeat protein [Sedimentisphaerales bacterium]|nr:tetratricopeptide repeat protein [Sedimentisphaerales bacterium]